MPECQKIKNGGLDQYGRQRFEVKPIWRHWAFSLTKIFQLVAHHWQLLFIHVVCHRIVYERHPTPCQRSATHPRNGLVSVV